MNRHSGYFTVNYPETEVNTPDFKDITTEELNKLILKLVAEEKDMTSFVLVATNIK